MRTVRGVVTGFAAVAAFAALALGSVAVVQAGGSASQSVVSAEPDWGAPSPLAERTAPREPDWG
ncbi:hypothetical protein ACFQ7A_08570 [Streptomyces sp. NPDC056528]|uniref:hypothetical protein n=1 Tax=Streptomyces sp. NPDC056528 TaxID=3345854 RepID=UPI00367C06AF